MTSTFAFLFVLGVLIFVHELGHFLMARRIGVRVLTFSLGFGPKLLSFRRGPTEYCISAIPLGGYVKMAGENPEDSRTGAPDEFLSKGKWQRFQVLVMGPIMNLILAVVVMAVVLYQGAQLPAFEQQPVVVGAFTDTSVGAKAGLQFGDRIVTVDGKAVDTWEEFAMEIVPKAKRPVVLGVQRAGRPVQITVVPDGQGKYEMGDIGVQPVVHPEILEVNPNQPAASAGLKKGDVILGAGQESNVTRDRLVSLIKGSEGKPLPLQVKRHGVVETVVVTPQRSGDTFIIGAQLNVFETRTVDPGPIDAIKLSVAKNWEWTELIVKTLVGLFTRETSVKQLMGPVAIADLSGSAAEAGWIQLFSLMAMISLNLGLLNLMPIPVLDGGHIFILGLEGLARRDFSIRVKEKMLLGGFVLLLMLMVTVIYNDLMRIPWIEKLVPWR
ncbi:MAG TPA: RIP metalloprotease RseP [Vicinamibacterales bacterium]|nr:RIP metalloprotease RseP [Vicinamibacterales bacterium]